MTIRMYKHRCGKPPPKTQSVAPSGPPPPATPTHQSTAPGACDQANEERHHEPSGPRAPTQQQSGQPSLPHRGRTSKTKPDTLTKPVITLTGPTQKAAQDASPSWRDPWSLPGATFPILKYRAAKDIVTPLIPLLTKADITNNLTSAKC